ncbi:SIR2 family protein [Bacillus paralicheniformis]|uniref:SIR2 family protein n=1 Tax=Bacillus paralicheniformis TaxID=1648923 RepID=UPI001CC7ADC7|nr:SIR2 family protein [Bacillus paralicheniformis]UAY70220.1 SIR2 family protein [Bacillus paralicheniformis]
MTRELFIPKSLIENAKNNNLVFFIGAGFSRDFGFPDWKGLVKLMLEKIIDENPKYKPFLDLLESGTMGVLDILEYIKSEKRIIRDTIYKEFKYDMSKEHLLEKHRKLFSISKKIITTNYDQLLEKAAKEQLDKVVYTNTHLIGQIHNLDEFILKIHGDHELANDCILLREDYEKLYDQDNAALTKMKSIIASKSILFIGFSLSDPYVSHVFEYVNNLYGGYHEKSFILSVNNDDFTKYNVTNIQLENHDQIVTFLEQLSERLEEEKPVIKNEDEDLDEDEFKNFLLDFNKNKKKAPDVLDLNEGEIENKYEKMVCSESFRKEIEAYSSYFPSIDEIMMSPSYIDFDKKTIITSTVRSSYNKVHNSFGNGESIFEATVDEIYKEYSSELSYQKTKLRFYIKILVSWTIIGCDIFNEDKRKKVSL